MISNNEPERQMWQTRKNKLCSELDAMLWGLEATLGPADC